MKKVEESKKFKDRKILFLLYPKEDETHKKALELIKANYDYLMINHDRDVDNEGNIKKEHVHCIVRLGSNPRWNTAVCEELGIKANYSRQIRNLDKACLYLIHFNEPDKFHYDISDLSGTFVNRVIQLINNEDKLEGEKVVELIEFIENSEGYINMTDFSKYCALNGKWDVFRRSGVIFCKMLEEHNQKYYKSQIEENI